MSASTFHRFLQAILWIFNIIYGVFGFITLVCGSAAVALLHTDAMGFVHKKVGTLGVYGNRSVAAGAGLLTAVGVFILVTSVFGCVALLRRDNKKPMLAYVSAITVLMVLQFAVAFTSIGLSGSVHTDVTNRLQNLQNSTSGTKDDTVLNWYVNIQEQWECCGVHNYSDWMQVGWFQNRYKTYNIEKSSYRKIGAIGCCYEHQEKQDYCMNTTIGDAAKEDQLCCSVQRDSVDMKEGCASIISEHLLHSLSIVAGAGLTFAFLEILLLVVSCLYVRSSQYEQFGS